MYPERDHNLKPQYWGSLYMTEVGGPEELCRPEGQGWQKFGNFRNFLFCRPGQSQCSGSFTNSAGMEWLSYWVIEWFYSKIIFKIFLPNTLSKRNFKHYITCSKDMPNLVPFQISTIGLGVEFHLRGSATNGLPVKLVLENPAKSGAPLQTPMLLFNKKMVLSKFLWIATMPKWLNIGWNWNNNKPLNKYYIIKPYDHVFGAHCMSIVTSVKPDVSFAGWRLK